MSKYNVAAFFDFDGTLTPSTMVGSYIFMNSIRLKGFKKFLFFLKEILLIIPYIVLSEINTLLFDKLFYHYKYKGAKYQELCKYYEDAFELKIKNIIFDEMKKIIRDHKKNGVKIVIISASPDLIIKPVAEYFGADAYYSRLLEVENGILTGRLLSSIMVNIEKDKAVLDYAKKNDIDLPKSYAYGDSSADIPMFDLVGNPVVINGRKKLLKIAAEKPKWKVLDLKNNTKISYYF